MSELVYVNACSCVIKFYSTSTVGPNVQYVQYTICTTLLLRYMLTTYSTTTVVQRSFLLSDRVDAPPTEYCKL